MQVVFDSLVWFGAARSERALHKHWGELHLLTNASFWFSSRLVAQVLKSVRESTSSGWLLVCPQRAAMKGLHHGSFDGC